MNLEQALALADKIDTAQDIDVVDMIDCIVLLRDALKAKQEAPNDPPA